MTASAAPANATVTPDQATGDQAASGRAFVTVCVAITCASLCYVACDAYQWPRLAFFPYDGTWHMVRKPPNAAPMLYVGIVLWGAIGFLAGFGASSLWYRGRRTPSRTTQRLWGAWALSWFFLAGIYYWWHLWPIP